MVGFFAGLILLTLLLWAISDMIVNKIDPLLWNIVHHLQLVRSIALTDACMTPLMRLFLAPAMGPIQFNYTFPIQVTELYRFEYFGMNSLMFYIVIMWPLLFLLIAIFSNMIIYAIRMKTPKGEEFKLNAQG